MYAREHKLYAASTGVSAEGLLSVFVCVFTTLRFDAMSDERARARVRSMGRNERACRGRRRRRCAAGHVRAKRIDETLACRGIVRTELGHAQCICVTLHRPSGRRVEAQKFLKYSYIVVEAAVAAAIHHELAGSQTDVERYVEVRTYSLTRQKLNGENAHTLKLAGSFVIILCVQIMLLNFEVYLFMWALHQQSARNVHDTNINIYRQTVSSEAARTRSLSHQISHPPATSPLCGGVFCVCVSARVLNRSLAGSFFCGWFCRLQVHTRSIVSMP